MPIPEIGCQCQCGSYTPSFASTGYSQGDRTNIVDSGSSGGLRSADTLPLQMQCNERDQHPCRWETAPTWIAGARAVMAVTPQMLVPAAVRLPSRAGRPRRALIHRTDPRPAVMEQSTTGMPTTPSLATSRALSLAPTHTMPAWRTAFVATLRPGCSKACRRMVAAAQERQASQTLWPCDWLNLAGFAVVLQCRGVRCMAMRKKTYPVQRHTPVVAWQCC